MILTTVGRPPLDNSDAIFDCIFLSFVEDLDISSSIFTASSKNSKLKVSATCIGSDIPVDYIV